MVSEKIQCVKVTRPNSHGNMWCLCPLRRFDLAAEFDGCEVGDQITIEYCEMTAEEFEAMPEFEGW